MAKANLRFVEVKVNGKWAYQEVDLSRRESVRVPVIERDGQLYLQYLGFGSSDLNLFNLRLAPPNVIIEPVFGEQAKALATELNWVGLDYRSLFDGAD